MFYQLTSVQPPRLTPNGRSHTQRGSVHAWLCAVCLYPHRVLGGRARPATDGRGVFRGFPEVRGLDSARSPLPSALASLFRPLRAVTACPLSSFLSPHSPRNMRDPPCRIQPRLIGTCGGGSSPAPSGDGGKMVRFSWEASPTRRRPGEIRQSVVRPQGNLSRVDRRGSY